MRVPIVPVLLVANTGMIVFALTLVLSRGEPRQQVSVRLEPQAEANPEQAPALNPGGPVASSWAGAEALRRAQKPAEAMLQYADLAAREPSPAVRSLLVFRQAQCLIALRRLSEARTQLSAACESPADIVRALARLHLANLDAVERLGLNARRRAYEALGADTHHQPEGFRRACDLVVARSMLDQALMLCNSRDTPPRAEVTCEDPFLGKSPDKVREILLSSCADAKPSALDVSIPTLVEPEAGRLVIQCRRAPLEDILGRLASATGMKFRWSTTVSAKARQRRVSIRGELSGSMRAAEIACGQAGLIARFTGEEVVVHDPAALRTTEQRRDLISQEAFSAWRRLLLRRPDPATAAPGHLLIGMLYEAMGQGTLALAEYRYVPRAYPREDAAAEALLRCGRLRMGVLDYNGAKADLVTMLDRYPAHPEIPNVYLLLAQCEREIGDIERTCELYMRLYDLGVSVEVRQAAALGAAECLYSLGQPADGARWVRRHLMLGHADSHGRAKAWALMAKCRLALGEPDRAAAELQRALAPDMPEADRVELLLVLSEALSAGRRYGEALVAMGNLDPDRLSGEQLYRYVTGMAKLYQRSGLDEKAAGLLRRQMDRTLNPLQWARLATELADCLAESGKYEAARLTLVEAVGMLPPGPEARSVMCRLAELCLAAKRHEQALAVARQLLDAGEPSLRPRVNKVLAEAHLAREEYDRAAEHLAAISNANKGPTR